MKQPIPPQATIESIVALDPSAARLLCELGIDVARMRRFSLAKACRVSGVQLRAALDLLSFPEKGPTSTPVQLDALSIAEVCRHIVATHHAYLRRQLPWLNGMARRSAALYGDREPGLIWLRDLFVQWQADLEEHTRREELTVFPLCVAAESGELRRPELEEALDHLRWEHRDTEAVLIQFRKLAGDFVPPNWASTGHRALLQALCHLEGDMRRHVELEDRVLFPRVSAVIRGT